MGRLVYNGKQLPTGPRLRPKKFILNCLIVLAILLTVHFLRPGWSASEIHEDVGDAYRWFNFRSRLSKEDSERLYLSVPNGPSAHAAAERYASQPHLAGSPQDFEDAKDILRLFQQEFNVEIPLTKPIYPAGSTASRAATLGLTFAQAPSAWIDVYYPYLDTPSNRSLEIVGEEGQAVWEADLLEDGDRRDEEAHKYRNSTQAWHGFSYDGEATGQLIYANRGTQEDYQELIEAGANLTGKIVLVRYGGIYRGLKIKGAQELGAAGVLIYSDPRDDGYVTVENGYAPYPEGPARNPTSVQRGSSMFLSVYPGDIQTPGRPAYEDAKRTEATNIPKIPSLPISWQNAQRLFEEIGDIYLEGTAVDGKRKLSGKVSSTSVKLVNRVEGKITPIWNTMASIPGHVRDEVVVIGCHRDAWVMGAGDPVSGTAALHEIVRGFGTLLRQGWRPLRTILFASWDAEEQGLIGSVEYGEDFSSWISEHAVAYLNVDIAASGSQWTASASPSLAHLIKQTAKDVPHPMKEGKTLWDAREDEGIYSQLDQYNGSLRIDLEFLSAYEAAQKAKNSHVTGIGALGSGSDFTVFLQRLGVPSADQGFKPTLRDPVYHYHSIYDSLRWQEKFADPDFSHHVAVAKHLGLLALRITDTIVLPLNTTQYALELDDYLDKVEEVASLTWPSGSSLDLVPLRKAISKLQSVSAELDLEKEAAGHLMAELFKRRPSYQSREALLKCTKRSPLYEEFADFVKRSFGVESEARSEPIVPIEGIHKAAKRVTKVNRKLRSFERGFISEGGIRDREWYLHLGFAPGKWLGYGATTLPGLTEAITIDHNQSWARFEAQRLVGLLQNLAKEIKP
ncbi:Zn-dependent exopeptidase [Mycena floridula]|nr:Zn-dependent exopeptidase [Mycena floridula]